MFACCFFFFSVDLRLDCSVWEFCSSCFFWSHIDFANDADALAAAHHVVAVSFSIKPEYHIHCWLITTPGTYPHLSPVWLYPPISGQNCEILLFHNLIIENHQKSSHFGGYKMAIDSDQWQLMPARLQKLQRKAEKDYQAQREVRRKTQGVGHHVVLSRHPKMMVSKGNHPQMA